MLRYQDFSLGINKNPDINFGLDVSGNIQVSGDILPATNIESDLGSTTKRFRDIYLSGNTIDLGGTLIQKEESGGIKIADSSGNTLDGKFNNIDISSNATISGIISQVVQLDVSGSILPTRNLVYDLGAPDKRWNDLYLSGNTIDLSGTLLSRHADGSLMVHDSNNNMVNLRANNIIAEGNLTVNGTTTTVNSTIVTVQDPIITLGSDVSNNKDKGIEFKYGDSKIGFFGYDDSTGNFSFLKDVSNNSEVFTGTQGTIEGLAFKSTIGSGTAPLTVTSSTLVTNLNADLLDGLDNSKFMRTDINTSTSGNLGIGTITPQAAFHVASTGAMIIPSGTTAQLPSIAVLGMLRFNIDTGRLQFYNQTGWSSIGGVSATGGNTTLDLNGYRIHTFTSIGNFTVINGGGVDALVIAGGGGGGRHWAGGGGAGGMLIASIFIASGTYAITVGGGGAGGSTDTTSDSLAKGTNGGNSSFSTLTAIGGGGGGTDGNGDGNSTGYSNGKAGGSGGGCGDNSPAYGGAGTAGQGFAGGGNGTGSQENCGGGGGGAGGVGGNKNDGNGGAGGVGLVSNMSGSSITYAGGGGGSTNFGVQGTGGSGGGNGGKYAGVTPTSGSINTGGGGGGGPYTVNGGSGGSGIVIIRYLL
uniref:Glycine-rich domain-containing protein n=1 Tax=viral metagenome TaxID=1070528 RepID=A0A6C0M1R0_9ZZZZ